MNGNIGIPFQKYKLLQYDNDLCIKYAVHKPFINYCNEILRN